MTALQMNGFGLLVCDIMMGPGPWALGGPAPRKKFYLASGLVTMSTLEMNGFGMHPQKHPKPTKKKKNPHGPIIPTKGLRFHHHHHNHE